MGADSVDTGGAREGTGRKALFIRVVVVVIAIGILGGLVFAGYARYRSAAESVRFSVAAIPLPADTYYMRPVASLQSVTFACLSSPRATFDEGLCVSQFALREGSIEIVLRAKVPEMRPGTPLLVVSQKALLVSVRRPKAQPGAQVDKTRYDGLMDTDSGAITLRIPVDLQGAKAVGTGTRSSDLWSDEHGLALLSYDAGSRRFALWEGKEILKQVQQTPPGVAIGELFIGERLTRTVLTDDGKLLAYDWETGQLQERPDYAAVAQALRKDIGAIPAKPVKFAMARGVVGYEHYIGNKKNEYRLVGPDGALRVLEQTEPKDELSKRDTMRLAQRTKELQEASSTGKEPTPEEIMVDPVGRDIAMRLVRGFRREEGRSLPPAFVDSLSTLLPLDQERLALLDEVYQRLIVITPRKG